jgi:hypothetical protein
VKLSFSLFLCFHLYCPQRTKVVSGSSYGTFSLKCYRHLQCSLTC